MTKNGRSRTISLGANEILQSFAPSPTSSATRGSSINSRSGWIARARERDALAHAARERRGPLWRGLRRSDRAGAKWSAPRALLSGAGRPSAFKAKAASSSASNHGSRRGLLKHHCHALKPFSMRPEVGRSRLRKPQQRRLPAARRPERDDEFAAQNVRSSASMVASPPNSMPSADSVNIANPPRAREATRSLRRTSAETERQGGDRKAARARR